MPKTLSEETERLKRVWEREAPTYDRRVIFFERVLFGDGTQLPLLPERVRLTGIDLSPAILEIARKRADELGVDADLREGDAQQLSFAEASFDTVVCTLSLCNLPDDRRAIAEAKRVLRPGGRLLLLDHVRASSRVWLALCSGCWNLSRGGSHASTCCAGR